MRMEFLSKTWLSVPQVAISLPAIGWPLKCSLIYS